MNSNLFKGNLSGFIEGYFDKYHYMKSLHNIHNNAEFYLFPKQFINLMNENKLYNVKTVNNSALKLSFDSFTYSGRNYFSQEAHFVNSLAISGDMFLKRYIIMFSKIDYKYFVGILNFGYSLIVFDIEYKTGQNNALLREVLKYLSGVEKTFEVISDDLYENLSRLLVTESDKLLRYYLKRTIVNNFGFNSFYQEFCGVSSPSVIAKVFVNNQKVSLDYLDYSIFK